MTKPRAILTDIEGTTSSIGFVHDVLFPYAAAKLPGFVHANGRRPDVAALLEAVREEAGLAGADVDALVATLLSWIEEDRKATPLKALQGLVWEHGYRSGDFTGHVYDDAVRGLQRWHAAGIALYVYSSGSERAQRLLFGYSDAGDLSPLISGYFDTRIGPKRDPASYSAIARAIALPAADVLFLSDVVEELDAAAAAGLRTIQLVRSRGVRRGSHPSVCDFDSIDAVV